MGRRKKPTLGERLREARGNAGLTQVALAQAAEVSQATLSTIEAGTADVTLSKARKLADALGVTLDWLCPPGA